MSIFIKQLKSRYLEYINAFQKKNVGHITSLFLRDKNISVSFPGWDIMYGPTEVRAGFEYVFENSDAVSITVAEQDFNVVPLGTTSALIRALEKVVTQVGMKIYYSVVQIHMVWLKDGEWLIQSMIGNTVESEEYTQEEWSNRQKQ